MEKTVCKKSGDWLVIKHQDGSAPVVVYPFRTEEEAQNYLDTHTVDGENTNWDFNCPYLYIETIEDDQYKTGWHRGTNGFWYGSKDQKPSR